jgi:hypothetical protein
LTVQIISIWRTTELMDRWAGIPEHVHAIHDSYASAREVYSARWRLESASPSARRWHAAPAMEGIAEMSRIHHENRRSRGAEFSFSDDVAPAGQS